MAGARRPQLRNGTLHADLCVIGAGSGGLSVAAGAVQMGASVVLVERGRMGGECLHTGCVPSKALIAAAAAAQAAREAARFGVDLPEPAVDAARVRAHVQEVIATLAPHDSAERFEALGCTVIRAAAAFTGPREAVAGGQPIRARRFVIATGSRAAVPPIPGLSALPFLTNETLFDLAERPAHLLVLGGGPLGVEMAQAFRRLGSAVTLLERASLLPREEPEAAALIRAALRREGVAVEEGAAVAAANPAPEDEGVELEFDQDGLRRSLRGSHLLVATGRMPNTEGLGLELAGIAHTPRGITVDARMRTTNRRVFALGDVTGGPLTTHAAGAQAGVVLRNALFAFPGKRDDRAMPRVTFADPELAQVGMTEAEARKAGEAVTVLCEPLAHNDRAQAERAPEGLAKIVLGGAGRVLGATLVAPRAGEMIGLWALAVQQGLRIGAVARLVLPYPTLSEISKRAAAHFYTPSLFGPRTRWLVGLLQRLLP
jgi:pyruvate/2-oxoglutarate dehydrogenase complex dihydrolipoamide dehydrogenase (E3) component